MFAGGRLRIFLYSCLLVLLFVDIIALAASYRVSPVTVYTLPARREPCMKQSRYNHRTVSLDRLIARIARCWIRTGHHIFMHIFRGRLLLVVSCRTIARSGR